MIKDLFQAFRAGNELFNSVTWKNAQLRTSLLVAIISAAIGLAAFLGYPINLSAEEITSIAVAVGVIGGLLNGGTTVATTTRIGLPSKPNDPPRQTPVDGNMVQPNTPTTHDDADVFGSGYRG